MRKKSTAEKYEGKVYGKKYGEKRKIYGGKVRQT